MKGNGTLAVGVILLCGFMSFLLVRIGLVVGQAALFTAIAFLASASVGGVFVLHDFKKDRDMWARWEVEMRRDSDPLYRKAMKELDDEFPGA